MIPTGIPTHGMMKRKMSPRTMSAMPSPIMREGFPAPGAANPAPEVADAAPEVANA